MPGRMITSSNRFEADILLARVRAVIRRKTKTLDALEMTLGPLMMDGITREVRIREDLLHLTPKEYALLEYLLHHKNQTVSREALIDHVWDERVNLFSNTVDVYIAHLRKSCNHTGLIN
jgi:DNA-binding response OmpR family regulator